MKKLGVVALLLAVASPAIANVVVNGDFSAGENGWTRWRAPWGETEQWTIAPLGSTPPVGQLSGGGGNGTFGWFQRIPAVAGVEYRVEADWAGDAGGAGWAEVMLFSSTEGWSNVDVVTRIDTGNVADQAFKKDSWGMNPPIAWDWAPASLSRHPNGNDGVIIASGNEIVVATKLGGFPIGWAAFDNIVVVPEPASLTLLVLGAVGVLLFCWKR